MTSTPTVSADYAISTTLFLTNSLQFSSATVIVLSGADGSILHQVTSNCTVERFDISLSQGGDINNDGFGDFLVGAPGFIGLGALPGRVIAYSGADGSAIHITTGQNPGAGYGQSVAGLGDLNGDGHADCVVGAPRAQLVPNIPVSGAAYVISGINGSILEAFFGEHHGDTGEGVDKAGDFNGDGVTDILVSQPQHRFPGQTTNQSRVRIYSGASGSRIRSVFASTPSGFERWRGRGVGDVDGDGFDDFAVGDPSRLNVNLGTRGRIRVHSGATGAVLTSIASAFAQGDLGGQFENVGDVDGDGVNDIAAGDGFGAVSVARIYSGATGGIIKSFPAEQSDGSSQAKIWPVGDQNSDGIQEIAVASVRTVPATQPIERIEEIRVYTSGIRPMEP